MTRLKDGRGMHYVGRYIPKTIKPDRVLAHNHIMHTVDMPLGVNGFRAWTWPKARSPDATSRSVIADGRACRITQQARSNALAGNRSTAGPAHLRCRYGDPAAA